MTEIVKTDNQELVYSQPHKLDTNPAAVFLAGVRESSRRIYQIDLNAMARILGVPELLNDEGKDITCLACDWGALRFQHTAAIRSELMKTISEKTGKPLAPATINRMLAALRGVLEKAWELKLMPAEEYYRARNLKPIKGKTLQAGRDLSGGEIKALIDVCKSDDTPAGVKDAAIFALAYGSGLRRSELVKLNLEDYSPETGELRILGGKGNKDRKAFPPEGTLKALDDWIKIRGDQPGALFYPIHKGGELQPRRMTDQAIYNMMKRRGDQAGVSDFSPHDFRRSFITDHLAAGTPITTVRDMAGHENEQTTGRYDRGGEKAMKKAANQIHVPY